MSMPSKLVLGTPQPKQILFLKDTHPNVGFGGARGGGKSWAVRFKAKVLALKYPGIEMAIVRTTYPEVYKNHIKFFKDELVPEYASYNESKKELHFKNGSIIYFMQCDTAKAAERFNGLEIYVLFLDEATHFKEEYIEKMRACVRGPKPFPHRTYWTCNPDGPSLGLVKRLFIDRQFREDEDPDDYSFTQSLLSDNEALQKNDPNYEKYLNSLSEPLKQAWLYGRWDVYQGMFFGDFRAEPDIYMCAEAGITPEEARATHRWTHVIEPFNIPQKWTIYRAYDFGYAKPFSFAYFAISEDGIAYMILEFYGCTKTPNEGLKWTPSQQFKYISELERSHPYLKGRYIHGVADPSIWDGSRGRSVAQEGEDFGVYFDPGINDRINGWMQCHERLKFNEEGKARIYFFNTCVNAIRTIPLMMYDEHKLEDLDTSMEDHFCDAWRYFCMANPIVPRDIPEAFQPLYDPLDQFNKQSGAWAAYNNITRR